MQPAAKLMSLATAVPPNVLTQSEVISAATPFFADALGGPERLRQVFTATGINQRHAVRPLEWYLEPQGWPERTEAFLEGACALFEASATEALRIAGVTPAEVDAVVSST